MSIVVVSILTDTPKNRDLEQLLLIAEGDLVHCAYVVPNLTKWLIPVLYSGTRAHNARAKKLTL